MRNIASLNTMEETKNRADQLDICTMYKGMSLIQISHLFTISSVANTRDHSDYNSVFI